MFYSEWFKKNENDIWKEFFNYLAIPSISADKSYEKELIKGADFVQKRLERLDMDVYRWEELQAPVLFAERVIDESYPTVLIYGHYDVQPADPLELWDSDPFSPIERDGVIYARGAEDNKGQSFYSMLAVEAFYEKHKDPKLNIKILIEGGEEIGSPGIDIIADKYKDQLKADSVWIVDLGFGSYENPHLSLGVRGITALEVKVSNAGFDLHSGEYGGAVYNPIQALCEMMSSAHDENGHIAIDGFYDTVKPLNEEERKSLSFEIDEKQYAKETEATCFKPQAGYSANEAICIRPTFEVNGIGGGYQGEGSKTIIPKEAFAKITCRLVDGQDPVDIAEKVKKHLLKVAPLGLKVDVEIEGGGNSAWARPGDISSKVFAKVIEEITGKKIKFNFCGGSIPLTAILAKAAGAECAFLGTALPSDRIHSPNENFSKKQFVDGYKMITKGLEVFAENKKGW
ncbi:MAG: Succinyl-diaminopimelate desuccinylase [Chlamydiia bacterium]|nr:Succinyl-diaminopimelate desuccinylase [Chlamydiia bacterium]